MTRYVVLGAGAIGASLGLLLQHAGHDVLLVARGAHLEALATVGCELGLPHSTLRLRVPAVSLGEVQWGADDVALLCGKSQHSASLLSTTPAEVPVACLQNGIANERFVAGRGHPCVGALVFCPASLLGPGQLAIYSAPCHGVLDLGGYPCGPHPVATSLAEALRSAGFESEARADIMRFKRAKLIANLGNAIQALAGDASLGTPRVAELRAEGVRALAAAGLDHLTLQELIERCGSVTHEPVNGERRRGGSSWQSLARGCGDIEADYLNGEIVRLGERHGVPTPLNRAVCALANRAAAEGWPAAALDEEGLDAELGALMALPRGSSPDPSR